MLECIEARDGDRLGTEIGERIPLLDWGKAGPEPPEQVDLDRTLAGAYVEPQHLGAVVGADQPLGHEVERRLPGEGDRRAPLLEGRLKHR